MNINAQELLLINKNMKFGNAPINQPTVSVTEPPVTTQPEAGLNALDAQAQNNIAFQGVKIPTAVRKGMSKMMLIMALAGGAMATSTLTSCTDVEQSVTVDMKEITALYQQMLELYQQMLDLQKINNEDMAAMKQYMLMLYEEVKNGNKSQAEFQQSVYEYIMQDTAMQQLILNQLVQNGKTQEEANKYLQQLIADVQAGRVSYEEAVKQLMEILGSINDNLSDIKAMYQQLLDIAEKMYEQQKINKEDMDAIKEYLLNLYQEVQNGNKTQAEFQKAVYQYMIGDATMQSLILNQLVENGKTQEEANKYLQQLIADVQAGRVSYEEAVKQIMEILGSIDGTLKELLEQVKGIRDDMNANHEEYMSKKEEELGYLGNIYNQGKVNETYLRFLANGISVMNENLIDIKNNTTELLVIAQDDTKYNELMKQLSELKPNDIDYQKFEEMFKLLNLNLQDAINKFNRDNKAGQQELIKAINDFKTTYINVESNQSKQLENISNKLTFIINYLPNMDQTDIKAAIDALTEALNNNTGAVEDNTEVIGKGLDNINGKLDVIIGKFDTVIDNISGLSTYFTSQQENWNNALGLLGNANNTLTDIKNAQQVTNAYLEGFKGDFEDLKKAQQTANNYLYILTQKADQLENVIKDINIDVNGGMTRDEFLDAMKERDAERDTKLAADFEKFIVDYGFDKVPGNVQTIKEFLSQINDKIANQKDYSTQLDVIIGLENSILNFLQNADFSNPDYTAKLDDIIEAIKNFKCNCECGNKPGDNDESIKDLENLFA